MVSPGSQFLLKDLTEGSGVENYAAVSSPSSFFLRSRRAQSSNPVPSSAIVPGSGTAIFATVSALAVCARQDSRTAVARIIKIRRIIIVIYLTGCPSQVRSDRAHELHSGLKHLGVVHARFHLQDLIKYMI